MNPPIECVYIARKPGLGVKIGHSTDPVRRIISMRSKFGRDIELCYSLVVGWSAPRIECRTHAILLPYRIDRGVGVEWFNVTVEEAKFALHRAEMEYVIDDTPDLIRHGRFVKRVDRGLVNFKPRRTSDAEA